ncbi:S-layer homology domain-containing protein [Lysinibacillus sphaericus]|uniref:S-layer homology domain-containing protein n=1 Tax=Lysinibacillus sphaericus TaxID=1421 RepID=UPI003F796BE6
MNKISKMLCVAVLFVWILQIQPVYAAASFTDVSSDNVLITEIDYLVEEGIIKGYPNGMFKPNDYVTKAQVAVMLTRALGLKTANVRNPKYQDVPMTHTYYKEIAATQNAGIFDATKKFNPGGTLSRGEMAIVLQRAFKLKGSNSYRFTDVTEKTIGYKEILAVANNNITRGYQDGSFKPNLPLTRAHFSAFMARALTLSKMSLLKDPAYVYTYAFYSPDKDIRYTLNYQYSHNDNKNDVWTVTNMTNKEPFNDELLYGNETVYGQAIAADFSKHYDLFIGLPLRIGVIVHEQDDGPVGGNRITVKTTDGKVRAGGVNYTKVAILEEKFVYSDVVKTYYFVDGIGLVKELHGEEVIYELLKRTKN